MQNKFTGEVPITIGGKKCSLVYDWKAIAAVQTNYGNSPISELLSVANTRALAVLLSIGLEKHHPEITAEQILNESPPYIPAVKAVDQALAYAYFGADDVSSIKKNSSPKKKWWFRKRT